MLLLSLAEMRASARCRRLLLTLYCPLVLFVFVSRSQSAELESEVSKFADSDPDRLKKLAQGADVCKTAANRWTGQTGARRREADSDQCGHRPLPGLRRGSLIPRWCCVGFLACAHGQTTSRR